MTSKSPRTLQEAEGEPREAIFISHAAPEDNAFTIWLGAKLAAMGYEVWADVLKLKGGDDWQRKLENALRHRACKMLLVANPRAVDKQGVRNEIQIASEVARKIDDNAFIIPLRMEPFEAPFLIAHAQYIDFTRGWARGLSELLETLQDTYHVPRSAGAEEEIWREIQLIHGKTLVAEPERLISNWLSIDQLPTKIRYYEFKGQVSERRAQAQMTEAPWPLKPFRRGFLTFARIHDLQDHFGPNLPIRPNEERRVADFLDSGWSKLDIGRLDARNHFSDLARQAFEKLFAERGLLPYALSGTQTAWWPPVDVAPTTKIGFRWGDIAGLRQIQGISLKRQMNWHFGVSVAARSAPVHHVRIISRLVFTEDGHKPFDDPAKMHRLRRSFAKTWRNARWRDMLLAFLHWLAEGRDSLSVPVSSDEGIVLGLPPMSWQVPVSLPVEDEAAEPDDDDPSDDEEPDEANSTSAVDGPEEAGDDV